LFGSLFDSDSTTQTTTTNKQSDERIFVTDQGKNVSTKQGAAASDGSNAMRSSHRNAVAVNGGKSAYVSGRNNMTIIEDLNSELAAHSIQEVGKRLNEALTTSLKFAGDTLGFTDDALSKIVQSNQAAQMAAFDALDETKNFASKIISKQQKTADERLEEFGQIAFIGMAILAGLLVWKG
jgi:cell division septum initiation protein DivIVA